MLVNKCKKEIDEFNKRLANIEAKLDFIIDNSFPKMPNINKLFVNKNGLISTPKRRIFYEEE